MPPLGKAVISSDCNSLPEVGGNIVTYINPRDVHAWALEIYKLATKLRLPRSQ